MLVYIDSSRKITAWNTTISAEESQPYLSDDCIWIAENTLPIPPKPESGKNYQLFLSEQNTFVYERLPYQPPTDTEILMQELTNLSLQNLEGKQERQLLAQQVSDLELAILEGGNTNV